MRFSVLPALAAGLALSAASAASAQTWDGAYAGLTAGAQWASAKFAMPGDQADVLKSDHDTSSGAFGGVLAGFQRQSGALVWGVEGDVTGGDRKLEVTSCNVTDGCWSPAHDSFTTYDHLKESLRGHIRLRAGWASGPNLIYVAAGWAVAKAKLDLVGDCFNGADPTTPLVFTFSRKKTLSGYTLGAGVEHQAGGHLVLRAEYVFDDFGHKTFSGDGVEWNDRRIRVRNSDLRLAAAYRF